jgi:hypothetical protein
MVIYRIEPEATSCFPETAKESRLRPVCSWGLFITQRKKDEKKCKQTTTALAIIHSMIGIRGCHLDLEGIAHEAGQLATRARIHTIRMEIDGADVRAAEVVGWQRPAGSSGTG